MPCFIHAAVINSAVMFREWSTVVDAYTTDPMTREEAIEWCMSRRGMGRSSAVVRIDRTAVAGTSSMMGDTRSLDDGWDTERCDWCGGFHHDFEAKFNGNCNVCGEPESYKSHGTPCPRVDV